MGRQIPKNVRQIGNVSDSSKIYIEDYVDTFLNQLCEKGDEARGAFLIGEIVEEEENDYIYVNGAIHMQKLSAKGKDFIIEETAWKNACEVSKEYFGDAEILGWCLVGGEEPIEMTHHIQKMHQKFFPRDKSIFVTKNRRDKEEMFYIQKFYEMLEAKGHYIYYEKNTEMQDYMVSYRKSEGVSPSEVIEDQAAKNFRSIIQEKNDAKNNRLKFKPAQVLGVCAMAFILMGAISWYDQRSQVDESGGIEDEQPEIVVDNNIEEIQPQEPEGEAVEDVTLELDSENEMDPEPGFDEKEEESEEEVSGVQMEEIYIVKKGDTLASISQEVYGSITYVNEICELNGLSDGNLIFIGQKLLLP